MANLNMSSNRFEVITQYVSVERAIDTLAGLIPRIGRHSTATRGGESFVHQSDARVLSGRERDYATIENPSRRHRRFSGQIPHHAGRPDTSMRMPGGSSTGILKTHLGQKWRWPVLVMGSIAKKHE